MPSHHQRLLPLRISLAVMLPFIACFTAHAATSLQSDAALQRHFETTVKPFIQTYCVTCHGGDDPEAELDLSGFGNLNQVIDDYADWDLALDKLKAGDMPPKKAKKHPEPQSTQQIIEWIRAVRFHQAMKFAGDPGPVLPRRLSNSEYDYTIRDLTGVDIRPAREFPVDPANQAGFDNSGESLAMSPALLKKYLSAARTVADHLVLKTDGFEFAPHPVVADTDRDKYYVLRIVDFYKQQPTDLADYFRAAWTYQHRDALGMHGMTLAQVAKQTRVSAKYITTINSTLNGTTDNYGPIASLRRLWRALPAPNAKHSRVILQQRVEQMRDYVTQLRAELVPDVPNLIAPPIKDGSQTLVLWKDRQMAANRRRFDPSALHVEGSAAVSTANVVAVAAAEPVPTPAVIPNREQPELTPRPANELTKIINSGGKYLAPAITAAGPSATQQRATSAQLSSDPELLVPADPAARARYEAAFAQFAKVFPDAFYISERARVYLDAATEQKLSGRLLSAGLHSMTGYFRDDQPLYDMVLDAKGRRELDRLWQEFDFFASVPQRMHSSFVWFERTDSTYMRDPEFNPYRPEDKSITEQDKIKKLSELYLDKAIKNEVSPVVQQAIKEHFDLVASNIQRVEQQRIAAEPRHLQSLLAFAEQAYRRPLTQAERDGLLNFYHHSREQNGASHEEAMRDSVAAVLMSPNFCYRVDLAEASGLANANGKPLANKVALGKPADSATSLNTQPLSSYALASRLSYFLWSSMPDAELLTHAKSGDLQQPEVLAAQARRMLKSPRASNFAAEFVGHWLESRRFEEHNAVDRERFPSFDSELREAMYQEPLHFFIDLIQNDRPVQNLLYGDYTFINAPLAQLYGIPGHFSSDEWVRVNQVAQYGRGGVLPMAVFLTANSPGLRTSPVKRGNWIVKRVLGEHIPPPPATVPALPADEKNLGELTVREALAQHRANPACAACHAHFDSFGLSLEGYGAIGERRTVDFGGRPVDASAEFPGGFKGDGLVGLRDYIRAHREQDFIDNMASKLLSYALGRSLLLSDDVLIDQMKSRLTSEHYRFGAMVEAIVTSKPFRTKRATNEVRTAGQSMPVADIHLQADNAAARPTSNVETIAASH
jgi:cytochrome c553